MKLYGVCGWGGVAVDGVDGWLFGCCTGGWPEVVPDDWGFAGCDVVVDLSEWLSSTAIRLIALPRTTMIAITANTPRMVVTAEGRRSRSFRL
jgi:hypothetical protein